MKFLFVSEAIVEADNEEDAKMLFADDSLNFAANADVYPIEDDDAKTEHRETCLVVIEASGILQGTYVFTGKSRSKVALEAEKKFRSEIKDYDTHIEQEDIDVAVEDGGHYDDLNGWSINIIWPEVTEV